MAYRSKYERSDTSYKSKYERAKPSSTAAKVAELEAENLEYGASPPDQDKPGIVRRLVDVLSRPNYAIVGAIEEAVRPTGEGSVSRAGRELLSGIGGLKGEKKAFGQLYEELGVPEGPRLSSVAPFLFAPEGSIGPSMFTGWIPEKGGMADVTARGGAGLASDIAFDPTTYITFGGASAGRVVLKSGVKYLNKKGLAAFKDFNRVMKPAYDRALALEDPILRTQQLNGVQKAADAAFEKRITKDMLDPGGVKIFGKSVVPGEAFTKLGDGTVRAMTAVPGGDQAVRSAVKFHDWSTKQISSVFSPFGALSTLPKEAKAAATKIHRDAMATHESIAANLYKEWRPLKIEWESAVKKDPNLGKKFHDLREKTGTHTLTAEQQSLYDRINALYDRTGQSMVQVGVMDAGELMQDIGYYTHVYKNAEMLPTAANKIGRAMNPGPALPRFTKERPFRTYREAVEKSRELHLVDPAYPELIPDYDVVNNLAYHIDQVASAVSRKQWTDDAVKLFGRDVTEFDISSKFDFGQPKTIPAAERSAIDSYVAAPDFRNLSGAAKVVAGLSDDGKHEFFRELFSRVNSPAQFADVAVAFRNKYEKFFPTPVASAAPEAGFVRRSGPIWGDRVVDLPAQVADDIENFSSVLFKTEDLAPGLKQMVKGYDWLNKWFKIGVYPFWPASMTRDAYNNMMLSFLEIGVGSLKNPIQTMNVLEGKGLVRIAGQNYDAALLKKHFGDLGIIDPGGRTFAQIDDAERIYSLPSKVEKALAARANIDNFSRAQLALNHMNRGLSVRAAADRVKETLFAYNELSATERSLFRRAIPFYTFPRKAIEFHTKKLLEKPGMVSAQLKPFRGREDENRAMTTWEGEAFKVRLDRDGKTINVLTGIDLPIKTLDTFWKGSFNRTARNQLGMISPVLKAIPELTFNKSMFTNRDLDRQSVYLLGRALDGMDIHPGVKNWLGYKKELDAAGRPKYTFDGNKVYVIFQSWALSRVLSTSDRQFRNYLSDGDYSGALLDILTGLRSKKLDLDEQGQMLLQERLRQLEDAAVRRGTRERFRSTYKPKKEAVY